jgi:hypothetical protein
LHTYELGIYIYTIECLFGQKKASGIAIRKKKKQKRETNKRRRQAIEPLENMNNNAENGVILVGEDKSSFNVFNDKESEVVNILARKCGKLLTQKSDRNLPRTYFPSGIKMRV